MSDKKRCKGSKSAASEHFAAGLSGSLMTTCGNTITSIPSKHNLPDTINGGKKFLPIRSAKKRSERVKKNSFQNLSYKLYTFGFYIHEITADGNCLFRAFADQIDGTDYNHMEYRLKTMNYLRANKTQYENFIENDEPFDEYVNRMTEDSIWAGQLELHILSLLHNVNVIVHQQDGILWEMCNFDEDFPCVQISYHNAEHYNSVRSWEDLNGLPAKKTSIKILKNLEYSFLNQNVSNQYDFVISELVEKLLALLNSENVGLAILCLKHANDDLNLAIQYFKERALDVDMNSSSLKGLCKKKMKKINNVNDYKYKNENNSKTNNVRNNINKSNNNNITANKGQSMMEINKRSNVYNNEKSLSAKTSGRGLKRQKKELSSKKCYIYSEHVPCSASSVSLSSESYLQGSCSSDSPAETREAYGRYDPYSCRKASNTCIIRPCLNSGKQRKLIDMNYYTNYNTYNSYNYYNRYCDNPMNVEFWNQQNSNLEIIGRSSNGSPITPMAPIGPMALMAPMSAIAPMTPMPPMTPIAPMGPIGPIAHMAPIAPMAAMAPIAPIAPMAHMTPMTPMSHMGPMGLMGTIPPLTPLAPISPMSPMTLHMYNNPKFFNVSCIQYTDTMQPQYNYDMNDSDSDADEYSYSNRTLNVYKYCKNGICTYNIHNVYLPKWHILNGKTIVNANYNDYNSYNTINNNNNDAINSNNDFDCDENHDGNNLMSNNLNGKTVHTEHNPVKNNFFEPSKNLYEYGNITAKCNIPPNQLSILMNTKQ